MRDKPASADFVEHPADELQQMLLLFVQNSNSFPLGRSYLAVISGHASAFIMIRWLCLCWLTDVKTAVTAHKVAVLYLDFAAQELTHTSPND